MALLARSLQSTNSPAGLKSFCNWRRIFFCCSRPIDDNVIDEALEVKKWESASNEEVQLNYFVEIDKINENYGSFDNGNHIGDNKIDEINLEIKEHEKEIIEKNLIEKIPPTIDDDKHDFQSDDESLTIKEEIGSNRSYFYQQLMESMHLTKKKEDIPEHQVQDDQHEYVSSQGEDFENLSEHELNSSSPSTVSDQAKTGDLRLKVGLSSDRTTLVLTIFESHDFARPASTANSIREHLNVDVPPVLAYSVHVAVMQSKKHRYKTKMRPSPDPNFDETIKITKINAVTVKKWCLRFRLYGSLRNSIKQVIGEGFLPLARIDLEGRTQCDLGLIAHNPNIPKSSMDTLITFSQCKYESTTSLNSGDKSSQPGTPALSPELMIGLSIETEGGRLTIDIKRGAGFPKLKEKNPPDTFIKVIIVDAKGDEIFSSKTNVKKSSCDPEYEETFIAQVLMFQIDEITLVIQGFHKLKLGKKFLFGTIKIGSKVNIEEGKKHWQEFTSSTTNEQIVKWHAFKSGSE